MEQGKVKVTALYPATSGKSFDHAYYVEKHMPLVASLFGDALKGYHVEKGIEALEAEPSPFVTITNMYFDSRADFLQLFHAHGEEIGADQRKCTEIDPILQISEIIS